MSYDEIIPKLQTFVETKPIFSQALRELKPGCEIRVFLDEREEMSLNFSEGQSRLEHRPAPAADVEFHLSSDAIAFLLEQSGEDMAEFGVAVVRKILEGSVRVKIPGSFLAVLSGGYLNIIKAAGPDFAQFLATHGIRSLTKVISMMRSLRG